jgi:peptidoglycan/LPS O-acetylase OafA/YrhL
MTNSATWLTRTLSGNEYDLRDVTGRRFVTLDGMRGVAAISVMFFHYLFSTPYHIFQHGTYAVDFFFILSGIVLTHSYGTKISRAMTFKQFMKIRMIRLYPFIVLGSMLGTIVFIIYYEWGVLKGFRPTDYALSILSGFIIVPYPNHRAIPFAGGITIDAPLFPTNIPEWSLFYEILASMILFCVIKMKIKTQYVVGFSFIMLAYALFHYRTLNVGVSIDSIAGGLPRTVFAFFTGVMMYQVFVNYKNITLSIHPFIILSMTIALFGLPAGSILHIPGSILFGLLILLIVSLIFAALSNDDDLNMHRVFLWLGRMSYGIYAIHWPIYHLTVVILNRTVWGRKITDAPLVLACLIAAVVILVAHLLTSIIDEPLRRWLSGGGKRELSPSH